MAEYELLADFTLTLKDEDEIFCYCSRVSIDDRDLLNFGETDSTNGENPYTTEFLSDVDRMKSFGIDVFYENDLDQFEDAETSSYTKDLYEKPLTDFDPTFDNDIPDMKEMGLPLSFCNLKGSEQKVSQFKIVGPSNEFSTFDSENVKNTLPKWEAVSSTTKAEEEFQKYWMQHGEAIVTHKWNLLYGNFVLNNDSESKDDKSKSSLEDGQSNKILSYRETFKSVF